MKASAKARAARLVRLVERAIEAGEFTPASGYLDVSIGPCGCAIAAASIATGIRPRRAILGRSEPLRRHLVARGFGLHEVKALEDAYEVGFECNCSICSEARDAAPEFYAAGRELRKFHPFREMST